MVRSVFRWALLGLMLVLWSCGSGARYPYYAKEYDPRSRPYVIGVGDSLHVGVWQERDLSVDVNVRPDGTITVPLIGEVRAAGRTTAELRDDIHERLQQYLKTAIVTVAVATVASYRFTVAGNVTATGIFNPAYYVTVAEAIAMAGGPNEYAAADKVVVIRTDPNGKLRRIPVDYEGILEGDLPEQNIVVLAGDTIFVP